MTETDSAEEARLDALHSYGILDTPAEEDFDHVTSLAARLLGVPIALISLVDRDRQWFKSNIGLDGIRETPRALAFCDHAMRGPGVMVVPDATADPRFARNALVTGEPGIRFYAGAPLVTPDGQPLGTLCVIDRRPHPDLTQRDIAVLAELAGFVRDKLELRRQLRHSQALAEQAALIRRLMTAAAEAPDFAAAIESAAGAIREATGALYCHVWRLAGDERSALFVSGSGQGVLGDEAYFAKLRAMRLTPANSPVAEALVGQRQIWTDTSPAPENGLRPAATLAGQAGVKLQLATPFGFGEEQYAYSVGLDRKPDQPEALAALLREATAALRPMLRRHMDEADGRLFRRLLETSRSGILVSEPPFAEPGPHIVFANAAFEAMTGYRLAEIKGRSPRFLYGPETSAEARRRIGSGVTAGHSVAEEMVHYRKDGTPFWASVRVTPVLDSTGAVTHYISSETDITQAREARLERDALTRDLEGLVAAIPGVLIRHRMREDGKWIRNFIAPGIEALTGFTVGEARGVGWWGANINEADQHILHAALRDAQAGGHSHRDFRFRRKDGAWIWIRILLRGHAGPDGVREVISIWSDVSEEYRLLEEQQARARELETVIATVPGALIRTRRQADGSWKRILVSRSVTEVTGHSVEEALDDAWWSDNVEPDVAARARAFFAGPHTASPTESEFAFRHKRGHWIWIRRRSRAYESEDGQLEVVSVWNDITEQRDLRLQRESLTADLQRVIATMPGVLVRARKGPDGRWLRHFVSPAIEALTGFTVTEALEPDWWVKHMHPEDRERLSGPDYEGNPTRPSATDFRFRHKQGHWLWIHRSTSGYRDAHGQIEVIAIWNDVTAEKRLLLDREELASDLQAVIRAMPGVLMRIQQVDGDDWKRIYVAPGIEALTGHSVEEALRPAWLDENLDPVERGLLLAQTRGHFTEQQLSVEFSFRHKQGHWIWIRRIARGHVGPDGRREVIAIWSDVTHEKRLTEQLAQSAKLAQLGEVATGMAHELNQPLAGISLAAENALRLLDRMPEPPERAQQKLNLIVDLTQRASDIIDHMRIFGRNETAGREAVALAQVIAGAEKLLGNKLRGGGVRLDVTLPEDLPDVLGKSVPLEQVIMNLISNACDAYAGLAEPVPHARRAIRMAAHAEADWVIIEVQDAAGGIPEAVLPRVFEPFFTTKPVGQGTGLGLSISYGIISDTGGTITATNQDGGCLMRILLPVAR